MESVCMWEQAYNGWHAYIFAFQLHWHHPDVVPKGSLVLPIVQQLHVGLLLFNKSLLDGVYACLVGGRALENQKGLSPYLPGSESSHDFKAPVGVDDAEWVLLCVYDGHTFLHKVKGKVFEGQKLTLWNCLGPLPLSYSNDAWGWSAWSPLELGGRWQQGTGAQPPLGVKHHIVALKHLFCVVLFQQQQQTCCAWVFSFAFWEWCPRVSPFSPKLIPTGTWLPLFELNEDFFVLQRKEMDFQKVYVAVIDWLIDRLKTGFVPVVPVTGGWFSLGWRTGSWLIGLASSLFEPQVSMCDEGGQPFVWNRWRRQHLNQICKVNGRSTVLGCGDQLGSLWNTPDPHGRELHTVVVAQSEIISLSLLLSCVWVCGCGCEGRPGRLSPSWVHCIENTCVY